MNRSAASTFLLALALAAGCNGEPSGVSAVDDFTDRIEARPTVVQVEIPDLSTDFAASMRRMSLQPSIRVGIDVANVAGDSATKARVEEALRRNAGLVSVATGRPVAAEVFDESSFGVRTVEGRHVSDVLGRPRAASGLSIVPAQPLEEGWYIAYVDVNEATAAGMKPLAEQNVFANVREHGVISSRFYVGSLSVWRRTVFTCGPSETILEGAGGAERICQVAPVVSIPPANGSLPSLDVFADGEPLDCFVGATTPSGRAVRGLVCPEPPVGSVIEVALRAPGVTDPAGREPAPMSFVYSTETRGDDVESLPEGVVRVEVSPHGDFALDVIRGLRRTPQ